MGQASSREELYHSAAAQIKAGDGQQFLFYWCCGATNVDAVGCKRRPRDPNAKLVVAPSAATMRAATRSPSGSKAKLTVSSGVASDAKAVGSQISATSAYATRSTGSSNTEIVASVNKAGNGSDDGMADTNLDTLPNSPEPLMARSQSRSQSVTSSSVSPKRESPLAWVDSSKPGSHIEMSPLARGYTGIVDSKKEVKMFEIELRKDANGFGFRMGARTALNNEIRLVVREVDADGLAIQLLRPGDLIMDLNFRATTAMKERDAAALLAEAGDRVVLRVMRMGEAIGDEDSLPLAAAPKYLF
jgi:hypothetical protein